MSKLMTSTNTEISFSTLVETEIYRILATKVISKEITLVEAEVLASEALGLTSQKLAASAPAKPVQKSRRNRRSTSTPSKKTVRIQQIWSNTHVLEEDVFFDNLASSTVQPKAGRGWSKSRVQLGTLAKGQTFRIRNGGAIYVVA